MPPATKKTKIKTPRAKKPEAKKTGAAGVTTRGLLDEYGRQVERLDNLTAPETGKMEDPDIKDIADTLI